MADLGTAHYRNGFRISESFLPLTYLGVLWILKSSFSFIMLLIMMTRCDDRGVLGCLKCMLASWILNGTVQAKTKILSLFTNCQLVSSSVEKCWVLEVKTTRLLMFCWICAENYITHDSIQEIQPITESSPIKYSYICIICNKLKLKDPVTTHLIHNLIVLYFSIIFDLTVICCASLVLSLF